MHIIKCMNRFHLFACNLCFSHPFAHRFISLQLKLVKKARSSRSSSLLLLRFHDVNLDGSSIILSSKLCSHWSVRMRASGQMFRNYVVRVPLNENLNVCNIGRPWAAQSTRQHMDILYI